ncbi:MAG: WD40 repeat domain-containing serine/threonine protein kinase [Myxococcota bacterium]
MTGHPTLLELLERSHDPDVRAHVEGCAICAARKLMVHADAGPAVQLPGIDAARRALADTRRLASLSMTHTWGTDPLREDEERPPDLEVGRELDRYVVRARIGAGGMGALYQVEHRQLGSRHALKVLHRTSEAVRGRLMREGQAQSRLQHANVVPVTDVVDVDGSPGLIMEFVDGPSLSAWLREHGPPPLWQVSRLGEQIVRAVAAAHAAGIVHRDLKPSNVLIAETDEGPTAKVCDFGLARWGADEDERVGPLGTPGYMAPEQIHDASGADPRSDIFSLGAVLYELATGERAFDAPDLLGVWTRIREGDFVPPSRLRPDLPEAMRDTIEQALEVEPEHRFVDCAEMLASWRGGRALTEEVPRPQAPAPRLDPPVQTRPRRSLALGLTVAAGLSLVAVGTALLWSTPPDGPPPVDPPVRVGDDRADRRLTAMPAQYQIFSVALSPDDSELLTTDGRGLWHQSLESGTSRLLLEGGPLHSVDWLPDGYGALVMGLRDGEKGTWKVAFEPSPSGPTLGEVTRVSDRSGGFLRASPDGERFVFADEDGLWVIGLDGTSRHLLPLAAGEHSTSLTWSPDGRFVATVVQARGGGLPQLQRVRVEDGHVDVLLESRRLIAFGLGAVVWMAPDRLLYALTAGQQAPAELHALDAASTATTAEGDTVLRTWEGYELIRMRAGRDSVVVSRGTAVQDVWMFHPGSDAPTLLTPEDWKDRPIGWAGSRFLMVSDRGSGGIFAVDPANPASAEPVHGTQAKEGFVVTGTAVGDALLFSRFVRPELEDGTLGDLSFRVDRVEAQSSEARVLLDEPVGQVLGPTTPKQALKCAAGRCLMSRTKGESLEWVWLDPIDGTLSDPVATVDRCGGGVAWDLDPTGRKVVLLSSDPPTRLDLDLETGARTEAACTLDLPLSVTWMPDGTIYASGLSHASVRPYQLGTLGPDGSFEVALSSMNNNYHSIYGDPSGTDVLLGVHSFGTDVWKLAL